MKNEEDAILVETNVLQKDQTNKTERKVDRADQGEIGDFQQRWSQR